MMDSKISAHRRIVEDLKRCMANMRPGARLPTERELGERYQVSRMTVNKAFKSLEDSGWLRRERGSGSFVAKPGESRPIKFLLPCPEYLIYECTYPLRLVLYGVERAARELGRKVEGVWVSRSNSPDDINWEQFDGFDARTELVVFHPWFKTTFPLLRERGCQVVFVSAEPHTLSLAGGAWGAVGVDLDAGMRQVAIHLAMLGRRRVAFVHHYQENNHPLRAAFAAALTDCGLPLDPGLQLQAESPDSLERALRRLLELPDGDKPDALLLSRPDFAGAALRLLRDTGISIPAQLAVMTVGDDEWLVRQSPPVTALGVPYVSMGHEAVTRLLAGGVGGDKLLLAPKLTPRESTTPGAGAAVDADCFPQEVGGGW